MFYSTIILFRVFYLDNVRNYLHVSEHNMSMNKQTMTYFELLVFRDFWFCFYFKVLLSDSGLIVSHKSNRKTHTCTGQCVARLTRNVEVVGSSLIKGPLCFLEQDTLPLLLSTGWFQGFERDFKIELNKVRALWKINLNVK